jgi:S-adenosylhomocysteine hydrolase
MDAGSDPRAAPDFPHLPLLALVEGQFDALATQPLAGYSIVCVQHLLASTGSLIDSLERCGADRSRIHIVGKAYSTNTGVFEQLVERGVHVANPQFAAGADEPYDDVLAGAVAVALNAAIDESNRSGRRNILLIDDGGHALVAANALVPDYHVSAVEQTTRGIRVATALAPKFCVVNVGRSEAKLELEAPLIGASMARNLERLASSSHGLLRDIGDVLVVGYGAVGRAAAASLRAQGHQVVVYDDRDNARRGAEADGFTAIERLDTSVGRRLVASSTGTTAFPRRLHYLLGSGSTLVNMGSSDLEFAAWELRESSLVRAVFDTSGNRVQSGDLPPWDAHYLLGHPGREILLVKGGFPVDFDGGPDPIPVAGIQLTRALLLAAALQAALEKRVGLVDLDSRVHDRIVVEYKRLQAD